MQIALLTVSHAGEKLPGSKPFWQKAQKDIISMIRSPECGTPHVFFTASSADIQWPDEYVFIDWLISQSYMIPN